MKFKSEVKFKSVPLFLFLCLSLSTRLSESAVPHNAVGQSTTYYYVKPSSSNSYPTDEPCSTLQQLANSTNKLKNSSIELIFLPRNHHLDLELSIIGTNTVSMHSNITSSLSGDTVVINCNHSGKFKFERVHTVSVISLTFTKCNGSKAIGVHQFMIEDSSFIGGAALEFFQTSAMLVRSTFYRNNGKKSHYVTNLRNNSHVGGAIVATARSNITVIESIFEENSAKLGGAIFTDFGSHITIINTSFSENSIDGYNYIMQRWYWSWDRNVGGGVLYGDSATITIQDSQFTNNTAGYRMCGGVVFIVSNEVDTDNNTAQGDVCAGVVFASWCPVIPLAVNSTLTIENSLFISNSAQMGGGVICAYSYVNIRIINSYFKGMKWGIGAVICAYDDVAVSITHSKFITSASGIVINIEDNSYLKIAHSVFTNNYSVMYGFIVHARSYVNVTIISSYFKGITSGGVIGASDNVIINIVKSQSIDNTITHTSERAIAIDFIYITMSVKITFTFCQFINNTLLDTYSNGIVHAVDRATVIITNCYFFNNIAWHSGNNIIIGYSEVCITVTHRQFTNNNATEIISIERNSYLKIARSKFTNNSGGRVTIAEQDSHVIISHSYFKNNFYRISNVGSRGAIYATRNVNITLTHSYFEGCCIDDDLSGRNAYKYLYELGGVVYADGVIYLKITYCQFINNTAYDSGGALNLRANSIISDRYNLLIIGSKFSGNIYSL